MSPLQRLQALCGFDHEVVALVDDGERRFVHASVGLTLLASLLSGAGMAYGALLTVGVVAAPVLGLLATLFVLNLLRLQHAGAGYPLHRPVEALSTWRPGLMGALVLCGYGSLIGQPLVILLEKPWLDSAVQAAVARAAADAAALGTDASHLIVDGLIRRARLAWSDHAAVSTVWSVAVATMIASPALLRSLLPGFVRAYERERWIKDRIVVDDAWAETVLCLTATLRETAPGFTGEVRPPYADPPYNTRPLLFGLDPARFVQGQPRFVRVRRKLRPKTPPLPAPSTPWWHDWEQGRVSAPPLMPATSIPAPSIPAPSPTTHGLPNPGATGPVPSPSSPPAPSSVALPADVPPSRSSPSSSASPVPVPAPAPASVSVLVPSPVPSPVPLHVPLPVSSSTPSPAGSSRSEATPLTATAMGQVTVAEALDDVRVQVFVARYLDVDIERVRATLLSTPPSTPLRQAFAAWTRLPTILLKGADDALAMDLVPLIAIAVKRPPVDVERRLRAAPGDQRVSAVFAAELARVLLRQKP